MDENVWSCSGIGAAGLWWRGVEGRGDERQIGRDGRGGREEEFTVVNGGNDHGGADDEKEKEGIWTKL